MVTQTLKTLLTAFAVLFSHFVIAQRLVDSVVISETFKDNSFGWAVSNSDTLKCKIQNGAYFINFRRYSGYNDLLSFPDTITKHIDFDNGEISFDCTFHTNPIEHHSGFGFVIDQRDKTSDNQNGNYNVIYFGEEKGKLFSAIIPKIKRFGDAIRQGGGIPFVDGKINHIKITKINITYRIYINGVSVLSFVHKDKINLNHIYITNGQYDLRNLIVTKSSLIIDTVAFKNNPKNSNFAETYVLLVGVKKYKDTTNNPTLNSPINDVKKMEKFWEGPRGGRVPSKNILQLTEKLATKQAILDSLTSLAKKADIDEAEFIFYFSGHGGLEGINVYNGTIPYKQLNQILNLCRAKHKVCIIDACFSAWAANTLVISNKGKDNLSSAGQEFMYKAEVTTASRNLNYLLSSDWNEQSYDGDKTLNSNSLFTDSMLKILNQKNKKSISYILYLKDLYDQITLSLTDFNKKNENVPGKYRGVKATQHPVIASPIGDAAAVPIALITN